MLRISTAEKSNGLNPQTWVPEASMLTTRPPKPSNISVSADMFYDFEMYNIALHVYV